MKIVLTTLNSKIYSQLHYPYKIFKGLVEDIVDVELKEYT